MSRSAFWLATACGLVIAGIVHIATVLAIPRFSEGDAFTRARASETLDHPLRIHGLAGAPAANGEWLPNPDPAVSVGVCSYDLDDGPMRVSAQAGSLMLSVSMHSRRGAFYAVTDQAAVRGGLDLVVMTRAQFDEALANDVAGEVTRDVRIVAPARRGFAVVRVIAALPSERAVADAAVQAVSCTIDSPAEPTGEEPGKGKS
ncbi:MAG: hypothetical protein ACAH20_08895 [Methylobacteriaceae bacterium]|jgi:uncharacterized membrane protein|uniref:DUF1254 domain-containing protein n=6 Tax=Methylorubrum extorquens TaxID=408 RepID=C5AVF8_METEA|nr:MULTISPECIES: hypothetical protein [Methylobacteriaceae]KQO80632.1 hypothetical protein ASF36_10560 [Methylobacterium sp. Leaf90]KQP00100.1 hypothetical protein ASF33_00585 [Methylobacterium sp. Leaf92]KQP89468.1 hypothetical protein ASF55_23675 [Methylobacterium sp. Leaf119]KQQ12302.1 hypothetical protein ASF59_22585 [Methylobacterium sp. Leaf121]MBA9071281.1 putative membrane protein [Methylobacterium sp. RAS18]MDF9861816.1 putative membrane protein [Methylorubrum pseudosasae]MDH6635438